MSAGGSRARRGEDERSPAPPRPFVVAAPSGTGKTTVCQLVVERDPSIELSVSHTTRERRRGEARGSAYHFVTREVFQHLIDAEAFLEWAEYHGNRYGTSWAALEAPLARGHDVLLEIEIQGARQVRERRRDARLIFLLPPSLAALEQRLRSRGTESAAALEGRLRLARRELDAADGFDYAVVNDDLERCVEACLSIVRAERAGKVAEVRRRFDPAPALASLRGSALPPRADRVT